MNAFHRPTTDRRSAFAGRILAAAILALPIATSAQSDRAVTTTRDKDVPSIPDEVLGKMNVSDQPRYYLDTIDTLNRNTSDYTRTAPGLAKNNYVGKIFPVYNTNAIELQSYLLRTVAFEGGVVEVMGADGVKDAAGKPVQYLYVTAPDFMIPGITEIVELSDRPGFKFYDQTGKDFGGGPGAIQYVGKHRTASELTAILGATELGNVGVFLFPPFADDSTNSIYIVDNPTDVADDLLALQMFDKPPLQLALDVTIYEISDGDRQRLGLDYDVWKRALSGSLDYESTGETQWFDPQADLWTTVLSLDATVLADFLNFTAQSGTSKVLTSTKITMVNSEDVPGGLSGGARGSSTGSPAVISALTAIPFTTTSSDGRSEIIDITSAAEGIKLEILPFIATETATLTVNSEVFSLVGFSKETDTPIISSRTVSSVVNVKDGVPLVLGGLERTNNVESTVGLPFLKDIPVLKYVFGKEVKDTTTSKVLIVLRPDLVTAEEGGVAAPF